MKNRWTALLLASLTLGGALRADIYVDDDAPGDLWPHNREISDPNEDGSVAHPFDDIQEAIDAAVDGDTIVVKWGRYLSSDPWEYDEIRFNGKNIRLTSLYPTSFDTAEATVLCGVVIFRGDEDPNCLLQGFKIQNYGHGGILGNNTRATISHCIIRGNGPCGATVVKDVHGLLKNCLIADNTTFFDCGVLPAVSGCWQIVNCTIANNLSGVGLSNVGLPTGETVKIRNSIIYGNQDPQFTYSWSNSEQMKGEIEYCLIEVPSNTLFPLFSNIKLAHVTQNADPCFVQMGSWQDAPVDTRTRRSVSGGNPEKVLFEGDYHLKSEGWRWVSDVMHWSHWYYDSVTSPAVDAGDPMDGLGEEPERAWQDPEGRDGFNHAIDMGAYGGTLQASMSPTRGSPDEPPGEGAVDLHDFWPFNVGDKWTASNPDGMTLVIQMGSTSYIPYEPSRTVSYWILRTIGANRTAAEFYLFYFDGNLYATQNYTSMNLLPEIPEQFRFLYPMYLVVGSTIEAAYNPFTKEAPEYRPAVVVRGTLDEVLDGTAFDPGQFIAGVWHDVIAMREANADGTPGEPFAIYARGFGPLMVAGLPVVAVEHNAGVSRR